MSPSLKFYVGQFEGLPVIGSTKAAVELVLATAARKIDVAKKLLKTIIDEASTNKEKSSAAANQGKESGDVKEVSEKDILSFISCAPVKGKPPKQPTKVEIEKLQKVRKDTLETFKLFVTKDQESEIIESTKRSDRGEHVINNDVLAFYRKSIRKLIENRGGQMEELRARFVNHPLWQYCDNPVTQDYKDRIMTEMVAHFEVSELYINANAVVYGLVIPYVHEAVQRYMGFLSQPPTDPNAIPFALQQVSHIVRYINGQQVYVDFLAKEKWVGNNPHREGRFQECRHVVITMFQNLCDGGVDCLMRRWVRDVNAILQNNA